MAGEHGFGHTARQVSVLVPAERGDGEAPRRGIESHGLESRLFLQERREPRHGTGRRRTQ